MYKFLVYFSYWLLLYALPVKGQNDPATKYAKSITINDLKQRLTIIAADSMEGRATGTVGNEKAVEYLKDQFDKIGLKPPVGSFGQPFTLIKEYWDNIFIASGDTIFKNDLLYIGDKSLDRPVDTELIYLSDPSPEAFQKQDLKGKAVAFSEEYYWNWKNRKSYGDSAGVAAYFVIIEPKESTGSEYISGLHQYHDKSRFFFPDRVVKRNEGSGDIAFLITRELANQIFQTGISQRKGKKNRPPAAKVRFQAELILEDVVVENVTGMIEGGDKPEEVLVLSAHFDHLGINDGEIYNGADDDASGVAALLEVAEAFQSAVAGGHRPDRSILFLLVNSEEIGLFGSEYYTKNPLFPLENTVANLNVDMVGRTDDVHEEDKPYIYLIGSDKLSKELHDLSEAVNQKYTQLELDYTYNSENDPNRYYYRSDHYNFAKNNIPVIFYFNGTHEDYHQPTDTVEKIEFDLMAKRTRLIYYTAWAIANAEQRIKLDNDKKETPVKQNGLER